MMPTNINTVERDTYSPIFSKEGEPAHGTMVLRYTKDTIYVILPGAAYGLRIAPSIWFMGWCPVCHTEVNAAHIIFIEKEVQKQEDICMQCQTGYRPNPIFFPQALALYDEGLDGIFVSSLPPDYIADFIKVAKEQSQRDK